MRAEAVRRGQGLRGRLLAAFVLVAVPPLLLLAVFVMALLSDRLERAVRQRLSQGLDGVRARGRTAAPGGPRWQRSSATISRPAASRKTPAHLGERHGLSCSRSSTARPCLFARHGRRRRP